MWTNRKNPRMSNFDYSSPGYYAVTLCTFRKKYHFGDVVGAVMQRSPIGDLVHAELQCVPHRFENVTLDAFMVMPNHVHAILGLGGGGHNLSQIVGGIKNRISYFARRDHGAERLWQRSFYDHIVRGEAALQKHRDYIQANPAQWADDEYNRANWDRHATTHPYHE